MTSARANIYAVADRAGVSIATVSRVQRGIEAVPPATRDRVLRAIEELRYTPNGSGRALATQCQGAMGIVFPDLSGPYYSEVILGVEEEMVAAGHSLFILGTHGRDHSAELVLDLMSRVDGMIVMGRTVSDEQVRALESGRVPGEDDRRAERVQLRLRPPRGISQGPGQDADGGQVRPADHQLHRHPGAYPGIAAEERGQAVIIAENLMAMSQVDTPIVCVVIGEGGSGGPWGSASATAWPCSSTPITRSSAPKGAPPSSGSRASTGDGPPRR